jgi:WD40 repeat protein/energy-coupling factor transporter ATP-binding protein EcfA2
VNSATIATRPYIGLRHFDEADAHLFYGRDEHVTELLAKMAQNRFVAVVGSSGCGKSSLVRAGLFPELKSGMIPKSGPRWKIIDFRPGKAPLQELAEAIRSELKVEEAQALVEEGPLGIARAVAAAKLDPGINVLILADQFEEVFQFQREEQSRGNAVEAADQSLGLARRLLDAAAQPELPIYVLLVMRSDYLGECSQFPDLPERMSESLYLVPRLRRDELQEAITAPVGNDIEPAVVQRLLSEVGSDSDQLPRLQHLLGRMWDYAVGRRLTMEHYTAAGGWEEGLEQNLEEVYANLSASQQPVCARIFQQLSDVDKGQAVRRRAEIGELTEVCGPAATDVVATFRVAGFLSPSQNPVDITHECILREWPRLEEWLEKENRNARRLRELAEAAKDAGWQPDRRTTKQKPVRELAGLTLQNLKQWRDESHPTSAWARRYLTTVDFETANGYLTWSDSRDQEQKKGARRRTYLFAWLLTIVAAVSIFLAVLSYWEKHNAQDALALSSLQDGIKLFDEHRPDQATAYFAKALRTAHDSTAATSWLSDLLVNQAWWLPRQPLRHQKPVLSAVFSPDSRRVVTASYDGTARVWDVETGGAVGVPLQHHGPVPSAAFNHDGNRVVTASYDGTAQVWDVETGRAVGAPLQHHGYVLSAQFSPDGRRIVTASYDGKARVWDVETGRAVGVPLAHQGPILSAQFSPNGRLVVTASNDNRAQVWDAETGKAVSAPLQHHGPVNSATFAPDGRHVVTASNDNTARIWETDTSRAVGAVLQHQGPVLSAMFSGDGLRVLTTSYDGTARVWNADTGDAIGDPLRHQGPVNSAAFSADSRRVVTASYDGTARVWDVQTSKAVSAPLQHQGSVRSAAFNSDGRYVVTASNDNTARIWEANTGRAVDTLFQHQGPVNSAAFSADGHRIVTASNDNTARVWDVETGSAVGVPLQHQGPVRFAAFSGDGRRVVTASNDNTARVWDVETGSAVGVPLQHQMLVNSAVFSPDGHRVMTASDDGTARVWDVETSKMITEALHRGSVRSAVFSSDGRRVITASDDGTARVWDVETGKAVSAVQHQGPVNSAAFDSDGRRAVTASDDGTARVWDVETGKAITELQHRGSVRSALFSSDGRRVVTASSDHTARVWEAQTGRAVGVSLRHQGTVNSALFSPDGRRVVTASSDHTARVWEAETGRAAGAPLEQQGTVNSAAFSLDGRYVVTASDDGTVRVWAVLLRCCSSQEEANQLASLAEAVSGNDVSDTGSPSLIFDNQERLRELSHRKRTGSTRGLTLDWIVRHFARQK